MGTGPSPISYADRQAVKGYAGAVPLRQSEPLVSYHGFEPVYRAVERAIARRRLTPGYMGIVGEVARIHVFLRELAVLEELSLGALAGDVPSVTALRTRLSLAQPWDLTRAIPATDADHKHCPVRPVNPFTVVAAAEDVPLVVEVRDAVLE